MPQTIPKLRAGSKGKKGPWAEGETGCSYITNPTDRVKGTRTQKSDRKENFSPVATPIVSIAKGNAPQYCFKIFTL